MRQEKGQSLQSFRDQFTTMRQVCEQLGLKIGQSEQGARAVLKKEGVTDLTTEQLKQAMERAVEDSFPYCLCTWSTDRIWQSGRRSGK